MESQLKTQKMGPVMTPDSPFEQEKEGAFSSDRHEDPKTGYSREARYAGPGSEEDEIREKQARSLQKEYDEWRQRRNLRKNASAAE